MGKREYFKAFIDRHPDYQKNYNRAYYELHREEMKARAKAWYQENKARSAERYQQRRSMISQRNRARRESDEGEEMRRRQRAQYAKSPGPAIARANKRRAKVLQAAIGTDRAAYRAFIKSVRVAASIQCHWCRCAVSKWARRIDHIVPLSRGSPDSVENLCCACHICNARKADKLPNEWMSELQSNHRQGRRIAVQLTG